MTGGAAKFLAGVGGCLDLSRTRVLPTLAVATFRIGLIMERGLMRRGPAPALTTPACGAGMNGEMTAGMTLEDVWI